MAELEFSQFGTDLKDILTGVTADIQAAWPDVQKVHVDRGSLEHPETRYAVIMPDGVQMSIEEAEIGVVVQVFPMSIFLVIRDFQDGDAVVFEKIDRADALIARLMSNIRYLGIYELPFVSNVHLAEEEPSRKAWALGIDFTVRCANWRYGSRAGT